MRAGVRRLRLLPVDQTEADQMQEGDDIEPQSRFAVEEGFVTHESEQSKIGARAIPIEPAGML